MIVIVKLPSPRENSMCYLSHFTSTVHGRYGRKVLGLHRGTQLCWVPMHWVTRI